MSLEEASKRQKLTRSNSLKDAWGELVMEDGREVLGGVFGRELGGGGGEILEQAQRSKVLIILRSKALWA